MDLLESANGFSGEQVRHPWETARLEVIRRLMARHVHLGDGAVVIDVGCGDAYVIGALAAMFPTAVFYGVDAAFTPALIADTQTRLSLSNLQLTASLDALSPRPSRPAALVLLMDVIEHVEEDVAFVQNLLGRDIVDGDTCVLVTVPAYQALFTAHDVFLRHYRRYSRQSLRRRLESSGLRVIDGGYFFLSLLPWRLLAVIKERIIGRFTAIASGLRRVPGRTGAAILSRALVADAVVGLGLGRAGIPIPGLSSYAVCRKSV